MPVFSIVTPAYNRAHFLPECLDSVLAQTFTDWECIVVDDGSTDDTRSLVEGYAARDARFRYHWQENSGASSARNAGIARGTGEWIAFLDSDDWYLPAALELLRDASAAHPNAQIVAGYPVAPGTAAAPAGGIIEQDAFLWMIGLPGAAYCPATMSSAAVRSSLAAALGGFQTQYHTAEDKEFWIRATAMGPVAVVQNPVARLRTDGGDSKHDRCIADGSKIEAVRRILTDVVACPAVQARIQREPRESEFQCWHRAYLLILEAAALIRAGDVASAASRLSASIEGYASVGDPAHLLECLQGYLFYPRARPVEATLRYAAWLAAVASHMPRTGPLDLRNSLGATASDMCFYLAAELRHDGDAVQAWHMAMGGLRRTFSLRSVKSMLRFLLPQHGGGHQTLTSAREGGQDAAAGGDRPGYLPPAQQDGPEHRR